MAPSEATMNGDLPFVESQNKVEDLSGVNLVPDKNPYAALINACEDKHNAIQRSYESHRTKRNMQNKYRFLSPNYKELAIDQTLLRLENPSIQPGFRDERNCFVFWARPPNHIIRLATKVQEILQKAAQDVWLMPAHNMHLTVLEVTMCKTPEEISSTISAIRPSVPTIVSHPFFNRSRLVKPLISFDLSAFALSFVPASGEPSISPSPVADSVKEGIELKDAYTYHHLRRDVFDKVQESGVDVGSRYQVPSAHITLGRYLSNNDHDTPQKRKDWIKAIEGINEWLMNDIWGKDGASFIGEWIVGQETGLDARSGALWYGGGRTVQMGEGF